MRVRIVVVSFILEFLLMADAHGLGVDSRLFHRTNLALRFGGNANGDRTSRARWGTGRAEKKDTPWRKICQSGVSDFTGYSLKDSRACRATPGGSTCDQL